MLAQFVCCVLSCCVGVRGTDTGQHDKHALCVAHSSAWYQGWGKVTARLGQHNAKATVPDRAHFQNVGSLMTLLLHPAPVGVTRSGNTLRPWQGFCPFSLRNALGLHREMIQTPMALTKQFTLCFSLKDKCTVTGGGILTKILVLTMAIETSTR